MKVHSIRMLKEKRPAELASANCAKPFSIASFITPVIKTKSESDTLCSRSSPSSSAFVPEKNNQSNSKQ